MKPRKLTYEIYLAGVSLRFAKRFQTELEDAMALVVQDLADELRSGVVSIREAQSAKLPTVQRLAQVIRAAWNTAPRGYPPDEVSSSENAAYAVLKVLKE